MDKAYVSLAKHYDYLQKEMDYLKWVNWVLRQGTDHSRVLEVGCGTGTVATLLSNEGYSVDAFDLSLEMIEYARLKSNEVNFYVDDACSFKVATKYSIIICFMDTVNYILNQEDLNKMFSNVALALEDDGVFLFDIHKLANLNNFDDYIETGKTINGEYIWHSYLTGDNNVNHDFRFIEDGVDTKEQHIQYIKEFKFYESICKKYFKSVDATMDDYRIYITCKNRRFHA